MKQRLLATVLTITTFAFSGAALAQELDAGAEAAEVTPTAAGAERAAPEPVAALEVATSEGESETAEGGGDEPGTAKTGLEMVGAFRAGKWIVGFGFALVLIVGLLRRFGPQIVKGKTAGYLLGYGIPMIGALGLSMSTGVWSVEIFLGALAVGQSGAAWHGNSKALKPVDPAS